MTNIDGHKNGICINCSGFTARTRNLRCMSCAGKMRRGKNLIERICILCGKSFFLWPSEIKKGGFYCSKKCRNTDKYKENIKFQLAGKLYTSNQNGSKNSQWKGGITPFQKAFRTSTPYKLWRQAIFQRDNYTCVLGGKDHGSDLQADHIKPFSIFPGKRLDINNGRTLCINCHRKTITYGNRGGIRRTICVL